jgi:tetratricopeptide (TPR) repeat protein
MVAIQNAPTSRGVSILCLAALVSVVACGDSSGAGGALGSGGALAAGGSDGVGGASAEPADVTAAIDSCYETLHGDVAKRADAIALLKTAADAHPDNGRVHLFLGMCSLAALAEDGDVGALADIEPALERAIELMPEDLRIPGWLMSVRVQTANVIGTPEEIDAAAAEMIAAADLYPEFNNVSLAIAFAALPLDTPYPAMAVERLEAIVDCGATDEKCRDNEAAPHNVPGSLMLFGDVHARVGNLAEAKGYYEMALAAESASSWPEQAFAQGLFDDVDARVASFADADPENDPPFFLSGARTCTACHR